MPRTLKLWNGRASYCRNSQDVAWKGVSPDAATIYAAAYSRADLRRMIQAYCGRDPGDYEIKVYWHAGIWGDHMQGITHERGLWLDVDCQRGNPVRLV